MSNNLQVEAGGMLTVALAEVEGQLNEVIKEVRRLRTKVRFLEEENKRLRTVIVSAEQGDGGHSQLLQLYNEGFHICPPHFARVRGGEGCLFCESFLEKKGLKPNG
ncbi:MAG: hypothetical protein PWP31_1757 [Clostridia bacterium]|nr:hypothetical protein [Clostridia bacterium]